MKLHKIITGPMFLMLFLITAPLQWLLMHIFGFICNLHNWVLMNIMESFKRE